MNNLSREEFERDLKLRDANWFYKGTTDIWGEFLKATVGPAITMSSRVLDLGCGVGGKAMRLKAVSGKTYGLDLSFDALEFCKAETGLPLTQASIVQLPYKDKVFDFINVFDVLEHVDDDMGALREIRRVMADDGRLLIAVPAFMSLWGEHDDANFHKRRYVAADLRHKLTESGFRVSRISYINFFLFPAALALRVFERLFSWRSPSGKRTRPENVPQFLNSLLGGILRLESRLIKRVNFPFGVAMLCVAEKSR